MSEKIEVVKELTREVGEINDTISSGMRVVRIRGKLCVQVRRDLHSSPARVKRLQRTRRTPVLAKWVSIYTKLTKGRDGFWRGYSRDLQREVELRANTTASKGLIDFLDEARVEEIEQILLG